MMDDKYQNTFRIPPARLSSWKYGLQASYFVTICTAGREHFFGEIVDGEMLLTDIGRIAECEWINTPSVRPDMNLELDAFSVMPNHFHAIIIIGENEYNNRRDAMHRVSTTPTTPTLAGNKLIGNKFGVQSKNLASIIRGYKAAVTTRSRIINPTFGWQPRFHDHIIRNDAEFSRVRDYIIDNPLTWENDTLNK
jgi:REP-associated tyrosine transposase